jgi:hypothetical protein
MSDKENEVKFRKVPVDPNKRGIKKKLSMIQSFAVALASRNMGNKKINVPTKQLRVLSCFGNEGCGGDLPQCEHLMVSEVDETKRFCGACGCGDRKATWLIQKADDYSKLDYPKVSCPINMPGFTNYVVSNPDEAEDPITRKYYIENMEYTEVQKVPIQIGEEPEPPAEVEEPPKSDS